MKFALTALPSSVLTISWIPNEKCQPGSAPIALYYRIYIISELQKILVYLFFICIYRGAISFLRYTVSCCLLATMNTIWQIYVLQYQYYISNRMSSNYCFIMKFFLFNVSHMNSLSFKHQGLHRIAWPCIFRPANWIFRSPHLRYILCKYNALETNARAGRIHRLNPSGGLRIRSLVLSRITANSFRIS